MSFAAIETYEWFLAAHILAAVIWVGGALAVQVFALRAQRASEPARMGAVAADAEWIGTRIFIPASLAVVVFGFLLIAEADYDYDFWIVFAIAVWVLSFLVGSAFLGPESGRLDKLIAAKGLDDGEVQRRMRRIFLISRIELVLLVLVVLDMALKPGT